MEEGLDLTLPRLSSFNTERVNTEKLKRCAVNDFYLRVGTYMIHMYVFASPHVHFAPLSSFLFF